MPTSAEIGKPWMANQIHQLAPANKILDIGCGAGAYARLCQQVGVRPTELVGLDIFAMYAGVYDLQSKYDRLIFADVRDWAWETADLAILGDVVEHMHRNEAIKVVEDALDACDNVLVSLPIVVWEQGECYGNPHEAHLHHWSDEEFRTTFGTLIRDSYVESPIGCYRLSALS